MASNAIAPAIHKSKRLQQIEIKFNLYDKTIDSFSRFVHEIYMELICEFSDIEHSLGLADTLFYTGYFEEDDVSKFLKYVKERFIEIFDTHPEKIPEVIEEYNERWLDDDYKEMFPDIDFEDFMYHYLTYFDEALITCEKLKQFKVKYKNEIELIKDINMASSIKNREH